MPISAAPSWARWAASDAYSVGLEEEVMLLAPAEDWRLAQRLDDIQPRLSPALVAQVSGETQDEVLELTTRPHASALSAAAEAEQLRARLNEELEPLGLCAASAGTHPCAVWTETRIASGARHQSVYGSMRELARREPTFGLHVHVGVTDPESAITLHNRLRCHLPLLLALSANSPFWQGRDSGLASARTPLFQAFPRVGPSSCGSWTRRASRGQPAPWPRWCRGSRAWNSRRATTLPARREPRGADRKSLPRRP